MRISFNYDQRNFSKALRKYADVSGMQLGDLIKKRTVSLFFRLYRAYRKLAPTKQEIDSVGASGRVKVRNGIAASRGTRANKVKREIAYRKRAITFTAVGWLFAAKGTGAGIKTKIPAKFAGKSQGEGSSRFTGSKPFSEMINLTEGAPILEAKNAVVKTALKAEKNDMITYIKRKTLQQQARRAGL